jgi:GrpE
MNLPTNPTAGEVRANPPASLERSFEIAVNGLIGAYDLSTNAALQAHIAQVLERVGVDCVEVPSGAAFDPSRYEAVSTVATDDPSRHQRVVETLRPGWRRHDAVLRFPQVSVWVADPAASGRAGT